MKDLDPKSLIIGFLTASVVALVVALIQPKEETKESEVGRYVMDTIGNSFLAFDTDTGTSWIADSSMIEREGRDTEALDPNPTPTPMIPFFIIPKK